MARICHIPSLKVNEAVNASVFRVFTGNLYSVVIDVIALDVRLDRCVDCRIGVRPCAFPYFFRNNILPLLCRKCPLQAGRDVCCNHCRFNRNRSAAAEGIEENAVRMPGSQQDEGRCQRLGNRSCDFQLPVAAFVEGSTRRIEKDIGRIIHEKDPHGIGGSRFRQPVQSVGLSQALCHGLLCQRLQIGRRIQFAMNRCRLRHPEFSVPGDIVLPGKIRYPFKKVVKCRRLKFPDLDKDSLSRPQMNIRQGNGFRISRKADAAVFHPGDFIAEIIDFPLQDRFQSEVAGGCKRIGLQ